MYTADQVSEQGVVCFQQWLIAPAELHKQACDPLQRKHQSL